MHTYMSSRIIGFKKILQILFSYGHVNLSLTLLRSRVEPVLVNMGLTRLHVHVKGVKGYRFQIFSDHPKTPLQNTYKRMYLFCELGSKVWAGQHRLGLYTKKPGQYSTTLHVQTYKCMLTFLLTLLCNGTLSRPFSISLGRTVY